MTSRRVPPSGTRDFFADQFRHRKAAIAVVERVFESFGFEPLETPAFERMDVLTGKYGDDEKLIFKIAKRGAKEGSGEDLALRYDFTVPFARFLATRGLAAGSVARRYQIGPVWRADRPAKGRFREFYQCDVDIVGSASPLADADVMLAIAESLHALGLEDFTIHLNSRQVLNELLNSYGVPPRLEKVVVGAIDKLHKIGLPGVTAELSKRSVPDSVIERLQQDASGESSMAVVDRLVLSETGGLAYRDIRRLQELVSPHLTSGQLVFDPFIARGLDYYTGSVFEVFYEGSTELQLSIASGGRYDELVGNFLNRPVPACGGSLGLERILLLRSNTLDIGGRTPEVIVAVWSEDFITDALAIATRLRHDGISTETYLGTGSLKAQLKYAASRSASACVIYGPGERSTGTVTVRNLESGRQCEGSLDDVARLVRELIKDLS